MGLIVTPVIAGGVLPMVTEAIAPAELAWPSVAVTVWFANEPYSRGSPPTVPAIGPTAGSRTPSAAEQGPPVWDPEFRTK